MPRDFPLLFVAVVLLVAACIGFLLGTMWASRDDSPYDPAMYEPDGSLRRPASLHDALDDFEIPVNRRTQAR